MDELPSRLEHDRFPSADGREVWALAEREHEGMPVLEGDAVTYRDRANFAGRIVVPGAFHESLSTRPLERYPLTMGYEHSSFGGTNPIGAWHAVDDREDKLCLSDGRVSATSLGKDVAVLVRDRAVNGLSIGFIPKDGKVGFAGEEHEFQTPFGKRVYQVAEEDDQVTFVTKGVLLETSVVGGPADDEGRLTRIQSISKQAAAALPGLDVDADKDDVRYSMALLMGGRGAGHDFRDLPLFERTTMYQRLAEAYVRFGMTPPPFEAEPQFRQVSFQHDERHVFSERYLVKRLSDAVAGARGLSGPISREGCAMALQLNRELVAKAGQMPVESRQAIRQLVAEIEPLIDDDTLSGDEELQQGLRELLALMRS